MLVGLNLLAAARATDSPGAKARLPGLEVLWEPRRRNFWSSLRAVCSPPKAPKDFLASPYFRDAWVRWAFPQRALLASVLWHVALVVFPFPLWRNTGPRAPLTLPRIEVTWYAPLPDLPPLSPAKPPAKASAPAEPRKPLPRRGADAFHPRQTILSTSLRPTHPRQTLIQPSASPEPPKILPQLPNVVRWATAQPPRPRLQISGEALARLRPKRPALRQRPEMPVPEVPNLEKHQGELNIALNPVTIPRPQLPVNPISAPKAVRSTSEPAAAPNLSPGVNGGPGVGNLIALSATPAVPAAPGPESLPIPAGNLTAQISISPEGTPGAPGGSANGAPGAKGIVPEVVSNANGSGPPGVSISGGNPSSALVVSGLSFPGPMRIAPTGPPSTLPGQPAARLSAIEPNRAAPLSAFDRIRPGASPESIFGPKPVYTLHVNMPNLSSVTGSWVLSFTELDENNYSPGAAGTSTLSGPVPLRKVDPKYPPALMHARVEGEVVLYAIIRQDGSVDSIQVVRGVDPRLDANAMEALARWKFRPAARNGVAVELEAIVHIPFRAIAPAY